MNTNDHVASLLASLKKIGCRIWAEDGKLKVRASKAGITAELKEQLAANKEAILAWLSAGGVSVDESGKALPQLVLDPEGRFLPFPLTDVQRAYLLGREGDFALGGVSCHGYFEVDCSCDEKRLSLFNRVCQKLIERHDMLRAVMMPDGQQRVLEEVPPYVIALTDLSDKSEEETQIALGEIRDEMSHQLMDAYRWPLFEIRATRIDEQRLRLHISLDLLLMDVLSLFLVYKEIHYLFHHPDAALPPLALTFRDCVLTGEKFQETVHYKQARDYWFARLDDLSPAPELPLAISPETLGRSRFNRHAATLSADAWSRLKDKGAKFGLTPSGLSLAVFAEILTLWSKTPRFTLNLTMLDRLPLHPQINDIIGDFTSLLLLEVDNTTKEPFEQRAKRIQQQLWEDLSHNAISAIQVLRELTRRQSGVQAAMPVVFTSSLGVGSFGEELPSPRSWIGEMVYGLTQTPQVWLDYQIFEKDGGLSFNWDCVEELFPPGLLDDMFAACCRLLDLLASEEAAWQRESFHELLLTDQLAQRTNVNDTAGPTSSKLLHEFFMENAGRQPDAPAVIANGRTLTYGELLDLARRVAHWLQRHDVAPNTLVGVVMENGWEQVVAVLGILMAGGAYLPIDAHLPAVRRNALLADGKVNLALTQPKFNDLEWPDHLHRFLIADEMLVLEDPVVAKSTTRPEDLAYVIYTSGSTGRPKGVMIDHTGAVNTILDINRRFAVTEKDRVLCLSALNFDLSVYDIFGVLAAGGALVMSGEEGLRDPARWRVLMAEHRVTLWDTVPALMQLLVNHLESRVEPAPESMRLVMMSGDWIPLELPERIRSLWPSVEIVGLGGATEASIWSNFYPIENIDPAWKSVPYGKPLTNQFFQVLDSNLEPQPVWVPGDLYIGGIGLAKGYWNDPVKTKERFITHPRTGERLYKTGDLGRYFPDGNLEFLGRTDFQVKIRGHRIELGEIEAVLAEHPSVREVVVTALGDERNLQSIAAYIVPAETEQPVNEAHNPGELEGVILDPMERLAFKLAQPGLRPPEEAVEVLMAAEESEANHLARRSYREFRRTPISNEAFGRLLSCLKPIQPEESPLPKYRYPSAGSLYPVQCYLYIKPDRIEGFDGGIYYHHPVRHSLILLARMDDMDDLVFAGNSTIYDQAAFAIFLIGNQGAIKPMYGGWAERFSLLEAGHMGQLLMEFSPQYEIGLCPIGALDFEPIKKFFQMKEHHLLLYAFLGGGINREETRRLAHQAAASSSLSEELKKHVAGRLPGYMVPATFTVLNALPLTSSGKIDRKALPKPHLALEHRSYEPPRTPLEQELADIWSEILEHPDTGVFDNFFELGGDSMLGIQIVSLAREAGLDLNPGDIFRYQTIAELAQAVQPINKVSIESDD
uniref:Amino acid adenylation domain-containing protein n=1 Tax=Candidatus Kentrum sp. DK TaxID=2126562 RepID=A0A450SY41_9GAMM|nr:MAG: amino acid adenylation domain-containing protein [Candidatus Kentron sp. DK]